MKILGIYDFYSAKTLKIPYVVEDSILLGDLIIFNNEENQEEIGKVLFIREGELLAEDNKQTSVLRKATAHDIQKHETNLMRNKEAFQTCLEKIEQSGMQMTLIQTSFSLSGGKINFIFTAESRVDFRDLVKELAMHFKKQIHLQQIGPRDRAKIAGGLGKCGQQLCCSRYLPRFESITMDMVRSQKMENKGSEKLSGLCGKLLCCLRYEVDLYRQLKKNLPPVGSVIATEKGLARVCGMDILNQKVKIVREDESFEIIPLSAVSSIITMGREENGHEELSAAI
ncbi:stage 0 sporulation protein [Candidatus Peregrinibacteria bacterium]|nr:stage 0 sporulation protein [Candidatus Peregrinibacteria bacterium]